MDRKEFNSSLVLPTTLYILYSPVSPLILIFHLFPPLILIFHLFPPGLSDTMCRIELSLSSDKLNTIFKRSEATQCITYCTITVRPVVYTSGFPVSSDFPIRDFYCMYNSDICIKFLSSLRLRLRKEVVSLRLQRCFASKN